MPSVSERVAINQVRLTEWNLTENRDDQIEFVCECAREDCESTATLLVSEYLWVRLAPRRFVVAEGHQPADAESLTVRRKPAYRIIQRGANWTPIAR
jgi:hypothetical protein